LCVLERLFIYLLCVWSWFFRVMPSGRLDETGTNSLSTLTAAISRGSSMVEHLSSPLPPQDVSHRSRSPLGWAKQHKSLSALPRNLASTRFVLKTLPKQNKSELGLSGTTPIYFLSAEHGQPQFAQATRSWIQTRDDSSFYSHLRGALPEADPELILMVGHGDSVHGFPPWLLKVAEIGHLSSVFASFSEFRNALERYAGTVQRWGV
jgi:hypothetical protein